MSDIIKSDGEKAMDFDYVDFTADMIERTIKTAMDISPEMNRVVAITPSNGYQAKIDLITKASDMSTAEKIAAINAAENKYTQDLAENAELYKGIMRAKVGLALTCTAGVILMVASPEGRRIARSIFKSVA